MPRVSAHTTPDGKKYYIRENALLAKIAAKKLGARSVAIVLGKTINLCNVTTDDFLKDEEWLRHELCHVKQFRQHGKIGFVVKYLWESLRRGYHNNKYEAEARAAEDTKL